ncbi:MAG: AraC family transcriptional regulator [Prevotella sp.]|nr:AraC family transcriptional regulator [Prevotella sp.]
MSRQPKLMSLTRMRDILEEHSALLCEQIYIEDQLAIIHGAAEVFQLVIKQDPPFSINDRRLGIIVRGEIDANINLVERHIAAGSIVYIGPGSIVSPVKLSPDLEIYGFGVSTDFPLPFAPNQMPQAFNGQVRDFQIKASQSDLDTTVQILDTLWHLVRQKGYNRQTAASLIAAQMHHYDGIMRQYANREPDSRNREQTIFDRFIYLVNQYAPMQHHIKFYADKMCLTERYLGTVVRQASGTTAKEWIDRALTTRIEVELRHSDKTIARIAKEMNFPNPSFFCKYFKRMTNTTPFDYRKK